MNRLFHVLLGMGLGCFASSSTWAAPRPNVVFILADDLGIVDIAAYAARFGLPTD